MSAIHRHRRGAVAGAPPFFDDLRIPGEQSSIDEIAEATKHLADLKRHRDALVRHKQLISYLQDDAFEQLAIEELNVVLDGSGIEARDIEERFVEDFELVTDGARFGIGEAKGVNRGISLRDVDQVNAHRTELFDASADELPGLLVVNAFRTDDSLDRRQERVHERVVRHARRMNVLVLRSWDLYELVARRVGGEDDSAAIRDGIEAGGGWLHLGADGPELETG